jgi:hypothetical protein
MAVGLLSLFGLGGHQHRLARLATLRVLREEQRRARQRERERRQQQRQQAQQQRERMR